MMTRASICRVTFAMARAGLMIWRVGQRARISCRARALDRVIRSRNDEGGSSAVHEGLLLAPTALTAGVAAVSSSVTPQAKTDASSVTTTPPHHDRSPSLGRERLRLGT
jgi:hypothetical protein